MTIRRRMERAEFNSLGDAFSLLAGCNFALRRGVIQRIGLFDPEFGAGARFFSAEDAEFFYRAWRSGEKLLYVPEMFVYHDHGRQTEEAGLNLAHLYILGRGAFYAKYFCQRDTPAIREFYWEFRSSLRDSFRHKDKLGWRHPTWLVKGFLHYMRFRIFEGKSSSEKI